jgi:sporadic carbohydrate cluster 2OG-Fe(II) oxygenase
MEKNLDQIKLIKNGYLVKRFDNLKVLIKVKKLIENQLKKELKKNTVNLKNYHKFVNDKTHSDCQWKIASYFWKNKLHLQCCHGIENFLFENFGRDILIQKKPFLRIARPRKASDNIGLHKDTIYGQSPYEMSIHIPLLSLDKNSCLKFVPRSHTLNEKKIKFRKIESIVKKGSKQHKLGTPYDPKIINPGNYQAVPIPLKFGSYIIFSPALIHGQELNLGNNTRFSFDLRVVNKYAPINHKKKSFNGNYIKFTESPIQKLADEYFKNNKSLNNYF